MWLPSSVWVVNYRNRTHYRLRMLLVAGGLLLLPPQP
ncbi:hypothetical protein SAMN05216410_0201 [Sanguibacter gelidistatuariae]|uniref:Uncharacterized protein n=1 Tax=Sanguibacter gelidistatuariae TaxID=1814289 RepID=A0A1G6XTJ6_9MICO|nr:hypothetical protein SAMN05216410_0201 [Sanguibacter gelidistatuariae]